MWRALGPHRCFCWVTSHPLVQRPKSEGRFTISDLPFAPTAPDGKFRCSLATEDFFWKGRWTFPRLEFLSQFDRNFPKRCEKTTVFLMPRISLQRNNKTTKHRLSPFKEFRFWKIKHEIHRNFCFWFPPEYLRLSLIELHPLLVFPFSILLFWSKKHLASTALQKKPQEPLDKRHALSFKSTCFPSPTPGKCLRMTMV